MLEFRKGRSCAAKHLAGSCASYGRRGATAQRGPCKGLLGQKPDGQATQVQAVRASHFLSSISLLVLEDVLPEAPPFTLQYFLPSLHFVTSVLCVAIVCHGFPHFISWVKLVGCWMFEQVPLAAFRNLVLRRSAWQEAARLLEEEKERRRKEQEPVLECN